MFFEEVERGVTERRKESRWLVSALMPQLESQKELHIEFSSMLIISNNEGAMCSSRPAKKNLCVKGGRRPSCIIIEKNILGAQIEESIT